MPPPLPDPTPFTHLQAESAEKALVRMASMDDTAMELQPSDSAPCTQLVCANTNIRSLATSNRFLAFGQCSLYRAAHCRFAIEELQQYGQQQHCAKLSFVQV